LYCDSKGLLEFKAKVTGLYQVALEFKSVAGKSDISATEPAGLRRAAAGLLAELAEHLQPALAEHHAAQVTGSRSEV
jgi:hypothetical protein